MGDVVGDDEVLGPGTKARVRLRVLVRCKDRITLWVQLDIISHVRERLRLTFSITVRHG